MIKYTVFCQTPAKKSMGRCGVTKQGKPFSYKDPKYESWEKDVALALSIQRYERQSPCVDHECWAKILVYRQHNRIADLSNVIQSVEDALQRAGCIENDNLIKSYDGSRVYHGVPKDEARFEVTLLDLID